MDSNEKSIERSKKSIFKLADLGLTTVAAIGDIQTGGLPVISGTYGLIKILAEHTARIYQEKTTIRAEEFYKKLLEDDIDKPEILNKEIEFNDYYAVLSSAIQDIEESKVNFYANLLRNLILEKISKDYKIYLLKTAKELTFEEIELLRQFYICQKYNLIPREGSGSKKPSSFLKLNSDLKRVAVNNLTRLGFITQEENKEPKITDLAKLLVQSFYKENELIPQAINQKAWSKLHFIIFTNLSNHRSTNLAQKLQVLLRDNQIPCNAISNYNVLTDYRNSCFAEQGIIFLMTHEQIPELSWQQIEACAKEKLGKNRITLKILLSDEDGTPAMDMLSNFYTENVIDFSLNKKHDFESLNSLIKRIKSDYEALDNPAKL
jgi:hypothetical protein